MVFNGLFTELDPSQTAAILSCFVCDEKTNDYPKLTEKLSGPLRKMNEMARQIAKVSKEAKMNVDEEEYISRFKPYMMDVGHEWCQGASFRGTFETNGSSSKKYRKYRVRKQIFRSN